MNDRVIRRVSAAKRIAACVALAVLLAACAEPLVEPRPPRTPTAVIDRYNAIVATAEAGDDLSARATAYYERGNIWFDQRFGACREEYGERHACHDPLRYRHPPH